MRSLTARVKCKPGWSFRLAEEDGALRLVIRVIATDSYEPSRGNIIEHFFPVPITTYNERSWRRWMFEQCRRLENHELGEWFRIDNERPFPPLHGPGEDPYSVHEYRDPIDAETTQNGSVWPMKDRPKSN